MEDTHSSKSVATIIIIAALVLVVGYLLFSSGKEGGGSIFGESQSSSKPALVPVPVLQLTEAEKSGDVIERKAEILARVRSSTPLTPEEKAEIGGIMLTKANIYNFSDGEGREIFAALSKP